MRIYPLILACLFSVSAQGATKLLMHDTTSPLGVVSQSGAGFGCTNNTHDYLWRQADTAQGSSAVTKTFAPTSTAPPCYWQSSTSAGQFLRWISPPLSATWTPSGNINYQAGCNESASQLNLGIRFVVRRWSIAIGGIAETVDTSATSTECSGANKAIAAAGPDATPAFAVGDRIVIEIHAMNTASWGANGIRTASIVYGAGVGVYGDTFANFVDTISFATDTNNSRAVVK